MKSCLHNLLGVMLPVSLYSAVSKRSLFVIIEWASVGQAGYPCLSIVLISLPPRSLSQNKKMYFDCDLDHGYLFDLLCSMNKSVFRKHCIFSDP